MLLAKVRAHLQRQKRDLRREEHPGGHLLENALLAPSPGPEELAQLRDQWAKLLRGLPAHHARALKMRRAGNTEQEIADSLGLEVRTIRRIIHRAWLRWEAAGGTDPPQT